MSDGLRALMRAAATRPLDFPISMYVGSITITGRVAPSGAWAQVTQRAVEDIANQQMSGRGFGSGRRREYAQKVLAGFRSDMDRIGEMTNAADEITLIDVRAYPAVGAAGTKSDGHTLPVARIPLASIDMWWIAEGTGIEGSGGSGIGLIAGVQVPLD
jgi:hypothetical protein